MENNLRTNSTVPTTAVNTRSNFLPKCNLSHFIPELNNFAVNILYPDTTRLIGGVLVWDDISWSDSESIS